MHKLLITLLLAALTNTANAASLNKPGILPGMTHPVVIMPKTSLDPDELAIIVNDADPLSKQITDYYQKKRKIPDKNIIHVNFKPGSPVMNHVDFQYIKKTVDKNTPGNVHAYALTWMLPYRVECMSITTAFASGFDMQYCARGCKTTKPITYYNTNSKAPYTEHNIRPTMMLAGRDFEQVKKLIDRGVQSDRTYPNSTVYLVETSDKQRSVRAGIYDLIKQYMQGYLNVEYIKSDYIQNKKDVLFYFTGKTHVEKLKTNRFVPGAIADHLTSAGGILDGSGQMSSLQWLEAGATGSYGAVTEPCNFVTKFPNPGIVISRYTGGETLIEAYWKSVAMPGQGVFIGEPLAKPFGGYDIQYKGDDIILTTNALTPGLYTIQAADYWYGPYTRVRYNIFVGRGMQKIIIQDGKHLFYKLVRYD